MTDWFRSWHGAPTDIKWLAVARRAGVAPGVVASVAWALMDRASQADERGSIEGYDAEELAIFYGYETEQVEAVIRAMEERGIVTQGRFTAWERRQPKREDNSADRVRKFRERQKPAEKTVKRTVTQCNAPEQSRTDTDTEQIDTPSSPPKRGGERAKSPKPEYPPDFEAFWQQYPRKVGKDAALKAWRTACKRAPPKQILAGVMRHAAQCDGKEARFIPHAKTWLNEGRWKDEPDERSRTASKPETSAARRASDAAMAKVFGGGEPGDDGAESGPGQCSGSGGRPHWGTGNVVGPGAAEGYGGSAQAVIEPLPHAAYDRGGT